MKKAIVVGASSGIGHEVARLLIAEGWAVGVAARRIDKLTDLQAMAPERVYTAQIDVNNEDAETSLLHNQSLRIKGNRGKRKECNYLEYHHLAFSYYFEGKQERASNGRSSVTKS